LYITFFLLSSEIFLKIYLKSVSYTQLALVRITIATSYAGVGIYCILILLLLLVETLMANPKVEKKFKEYLQNNYGKMAERNGGVNGFYGTFDLHLEKAFKLYKTHILEVSLDVFNVANLLNKDWGVGKNLSNVPLYYITGFDQEKKQYKYAVNTNAGVAGGNGNPYQCQLGIRYRF
jgi:hypothetical protein